MEGWLLFGLIIIGLLVAAPVMASIALARTRATQRELEQLKFEVVVLRRQLSEGETRAPGPAKPSVAPESVLAPAPVAKPEPVVAKAPEPPRPSAPQAAPATPPVEPAAATDWAKTSASIERMIAANWLVWVGGAALALGGIFLVRYALEQGYFGPLPRTVAAVIAGIAMIAGSEWLRRRMPDNAIGQIGYAPLAVAAAGAVTLYGAAYAAGPLYHFLSPELTLAGFVAASAVAVGLAVIHGVFLAALGLAGGYVAPLLVGGGTPEPTLLLAYAFAVTLACLVLVRAFDWRRIVWVALLGAGAWMMLGVGMVGLTNGPISVAGYGLALLVAAIGFAWSDADVALIVRGKPDEPRDAAEPDAGRGDGVLDRGGRGPAGGNCSGAWGAGRSAADRAGRLWRCGDLRRLAQAGVRDCAAVRRGGVSAWAFLDAGRARIPGHVRVRRCVDSAIWRSGVPHLPLCRVRVDGRAGVRLRRLVRDAEPASSHGDGGGLGIRAARPADHRVPQAGAGPAAFLLGTRGRTDRAAEPAGAGGHTALGARA